ncbi:uncharacterized protein BT62DRAFT_997187 [Guyanagaster necrorhizus]|uniref:Uncharacterized protein n=1 Tax=Guyanagaster necrorhizus TaxID=856835 RepID=A0A9P7VIV3_9AGAR|nr:uncharacterized protein BT62DRAFT_997187 [Guyanagaster necrorhizus MCA 3950]KAG7441383.1 hypothetical protein BT62DRAFT_997187 [Guyanagaster necrorhizus MCA 3950]
MTGPGGPVSMAIARIRRGKMYLLGMASSSLVMYQQQGQAVDHPRTFKNSEGLTMRCLNQTAFLEDPLVSDGLYVNGHSGPDRVIFATNSEYSITILSSRWQATAEAWMTYLPDSRERYWRQEFESVSQNAFLKHQPSPPPGPPSACIFHCASKGRGSRNGCCDWKRNKGDTKGKLVVEEDQ